MAKKHAKEWMVYLQSATAGTYNQILGQTGLEWTRSQNQIDVSDKNTGNYKTYISGQVSLSVKVDGNVDLPDANGLLRAHTLGAAGTSEKIQIRKTPFAVGDVIFEGLMSIEGPTYGASGDDKQTYSITFNAAAAPVTDTIG